MSWSNRVPSLRVCSSLLLGAAVVVASSPASASEPTPQRYNWTGISIYAGIGAAKMDADVDVMDKTNYHLWQKCRKLKENNSYAYDYCRNYRESRRIRRAYEAESESDVSVLGTVGVGADVEFSPGFVAGVFADFDKSNASVSYSGESVYQRYYGAARYGTGIEGELEMDYSYSIGGRFGVLSESRQTMIYVLAAYTRAHMKDSTATVGYGARLPYRYGGNGVFGRSTTVAMPDTFSGLTLGLGGQVKLTDAWSLKAEGRYTNLRSKSVTYGDKRWRGASREITYGHGKKYDRVGTLGVRTQSHGKIDVDPDIYSARVVLTYSFN